MIMLHRVYCSDEKSITTGLPYVTEYYCVTLDGLGVLDSSWTCAWLLVVEDIRALIAINMMLGGEVK